MHEIDLKGTVYRSLQSFPLGVQAPLTLCQKRGDYPFEEKEYLTAPGDYLGSSSQPDQHWFEAKWICASLELEKKEEKVNVHQKQPSHQTSRLPGRSVLCTTSILTQRAITSGPEALVADSISAVVFY